MFKRWNVLVFSVLPILSMLIMLTGCTGAKNETANSPDYFYSQVQLGMEKSQVESALGVKPEEIDETYVYIDNQTGYGVQISYDISDQVVSKMLYHEDDTKVMELSNASVTEDQLAGITEGMPYQEVKSLLGSRGNRNNRDG